MTHPPDSIARPHAPSGPEQLLELANAFARHKGLTIATVGTYAGRDGKTFKRLEDGKTCTFRRAAKLVAWFDANWPADLDWPAGVTRPAAKPTPTDA